MKKARETGPFFVLEKIEIIGNYMQFTPPILCISLAVISMEVYNKFNHLIDLYHQLNAAIMLDKYPIEGAKLVVISMDMRTRVSEKQN